MVGTKRWFKWIKKTKKRKKKKGVFFFFFCCIKVIVFFLFGFMRIAGSNGGFSAGDLYRMVVQENFLPMTAVVDGGKSFFAFKTRESINIPTSRSVFSQDSFEKFWYKKYGVQLEGEFAKYI